MVTPNARLAQRLKAPNQASPVRWATMISAAGVNANGITSAIIVRPANATATDGSQDIQCGWVCAAEPAVGSLCRIEVTDGDVYVTGVVGPDGLRAQPEAVTAFRVTVNVTGGLGSVAVSFPSGMFTDIPVLPAPGVLGGTPFIAWWSARSANTGTIQVQQVGALSFTGTREVNYVAFQMTSTSGSG